MSCCPGIPTHTVPASTCQYTTCQVKTTNPPTFTCVASVFLFTPSFVQKGFVKKKATGAYLPACTACQMQIVTKSINSTMADPDYPFIGLPVSLPASSGFNAEDIEQSE